MTSSLLLSPIIQGRHHCRSQQTCRPSLRVTLAGWLSVGNLHPHTPLSFAFQVRCLWSRPSTPKLNTLSNHRVRGMSLSPVTPCLPTYQGQ